jgi:hypothetical protein
MIAGLIESHLGASQYAVRVSYDTTAADALLVENEKVLAEVTAQKDWALNQISLLITEIINILSFIYNTEDGRAAAQALVNEDLRLVESHNFDIDLLSSEILRITKINEFIERNKGADKVLTIYSNLYDETLTGIVAVELIAGVIDAGVIITRGVQGELLSRAVNISKFHVFSNFALMPGWLKWAQVFSIATVEAVGETIDGTMATLSNQLNLLAPVLAFDKPTVSVASTYPYQVGDQALVQFDANGVQSLNGWYTEPRSLAETLAIFVKDLYRYPDQTTHIFEYEAVSMNTGLVVYSEQWQASNSSDGSEPQMLKDLRLAEVNPLIAVSTVGAKELTGILLDNLNSQIIFDYTIDGAAFQKTTPMTDFIPAVEDQRTLGWPGVVETGTYYFISWNIGMENDYYHASWAETTDLGNLVRTYAGADVFLLPVFVNIYQEGRYVSDDSFRSAQTPGIHYNIVLDADFNIIATPLLYTQWIQYDTDLETAVLWQE